MGKKSVREDKTPYQLAREDAGLTREAAAEKLYTSADRLVRIEKLSRLLGFVNEETSGHVSAQLPDHKHRLIIHLENLIRHDPPLFVHTLHQRSRRPGQSLRSDVPRRDSRPVRSA